MASGGLLSFSRLGPGTAAGRQLRRLPPVENGPLHRDVGELFPVLGPAEKQPAPAHVPPAHEIPREQETRAERLEQDFEILAGGDAAEENDLRSRADAPGQPAGVARERAGVRFDLLPD